MTDIRRVGAMEIDQDLSLQRRMWVVQRVGWVVMACLLLVALLGLFGPGPLSDTTVTQGGLRVDYERFNRYRSPGTLRFSLPGEYTTQNEVQLWLDRPALDALQVDSIVPEPESVGGGAERVVYTFTVAEPGRPVLVTFRLTYDAMGTRTVRAGIEGGPEVGFWLLTYP